MKYTAATALAAFIGLASARTCKNITVPVTISARNGLFDKTALTPITNIDVTNFILNLSQQGMNYTSNVIEGYDTVSGTYNLATTYCAPDSGAPSVVQLLTHGIGFDRSYWDFPYNGYNYSYVAEAVDEYGFATFSWDRLGVGMSAHGEPVNEIQAYLEVAALAALTNDLRAGNISSVPKFSKVVHVGHSFGSEHTYLLTAMYPGISDGIALTGFSQNGSFVPFFELGGRFDQANLNPALAAFPDGYLAPADVSGVQTNFFAPGAFDPAILPATFASGQPVTVGELLTIGGETGVPNTFKGPVLIITGERDIPYCGGNCLAPPTGYPNIPSTSVKNFPDASEFEVVIVPGTGHGLNLQYSHPFTFGTINNFFVLNGMAPNGTKIHSPGMTTLASYTGPSTTSTMSGTACPTVTVTKAASASGMTTVKTGTAMSSAASSSSTEAYGHGYGPWASASATHGWPGSEHGGW